MEATGEGRDRAAGNTYIGVVANLLNDVVVEVTSIATEARAEVKGVLHAGEDILDRVEETTLAELEGLLVAGAVHVRDPGVVRLGLGLVDVVLELDDVGAGDGIGVGGIEDGSGFVVDGANLEGDGLGQAGHGEGGDGGLHGDEAGANQSWGVDDADLPAEVCVQTKSRCDQRMKSTSKEEEKREGRRWGSHQLDKRRGDGCDDGGRGKAMRSEERNEEEAERMTSAVLRG